MNAQTTGSMVAREDRGHIAVVRMSHGKVSALDAEFCAALRAALAEIANSPSRAAIITGTGTAFSAGVDLFRVLEGGGDYVGRFLPEMNSFFRALLEFPKPLVAAVNGHAIAGGCIIAAAADYRVMARGTGRIGVPELVVGVPFPAMPFEIVSARVTPALRRALIYTGRTVEADEAAAVGFVDEAIDAGQLLDRAVVVADQLGAIPPATFALTKRALIAPIVERVARADDTEIIEAWSSEPVRDAIRAYLDRTIRRASPPS